MEQIIGRNFSYFFSPEDIEIGKPDEMLRITAANGWHEEHAMLVRRDGPQFLASITFTALRDNRGTLCGFSEFSHDLSEKVAVVLLSEEEHAEDAAVTVRRICRRECRSRSMTSVRLTPVSALLESCL